MQNTDISVDLFTDAILFSDFFIQIKQKASPLDLPYQI